MTKLSDDEKPLSRRGAKPGDQRALKPPEARKVRPGVSLERDQHAYFVGEFGASKTLQALLSAMIDAQSNGGRIDRARLEEILNIKIT